MDCETEGNIEANMLMYRLDNMIGDTVMGEYREYEIAQCKGNVAVLEVRKETEERAETAFLETENIADLLDAYLSGCKIVSHYILERYRISTQPGAAITRPWIEEIPNTGFLKEAIDKKKDFILCTSKESEQTEIYILGLALARMGCGVSIIAYPAQIEVDSPIDMQETAAVSMDNMTAENGMAIIPAIELIHNGQSLGSNVPEIISTLTRAGKGKRCYVLLATSYYMEELARTDLLRRDLQNLYIQTADWKKGNISFGWVGSYLTYIGEIYGMDVEAAIHREPRCRFSIVIPARNSSFTLRHTLKSCLNQRYRGSYEIIISDNSADGNTEVYQMVQEFKDERIRYFRTPRELHLPKSFEYAFLQAGGEYILSIGSDDALLPWTLEVLDEVIERYPDEEVIYWERGFYAWPGFNGGQENQFIIPRRYQKGQYGERYINTASFLTAALKQPAHMYAMPLLYINSMFRRSYFDTLLAHTGRLWDGICQDIYMGVVTSLILPRVLCLQYPLSIAGMSPGSVGATSNAAIKGMDAGAEYYRDVFSTGNIGGFAMSETEMLFPEVTTDVSSLYNCFLKAVARGLLPEGILWEEDGVDWKAWFLNCYRTLSKQDIYFCLKMQKFRFAAMKHGEDFLKWFDETIYKDAMEPVVFADAANTGRSYQEEEEECIVLDASKRNVYNVYEASLLFENLSGL
nr:glycosyltransferase family 2 protein [uncultured Acetatifactor sp.]